MAHIMNTEPASSSPATQATSDLAPPTSSAYPMAHGAGKTRGRAARVSNNIT